ncbi:MAG: tetratricopeptide repeat protein, partial [Armatimonadota bacterium]
SSRPDMYRVGAVASEGDWRERERIRWTRVRRNGQFLGLVVGLWLPFVLIDGWRRRKDLSNLPNYALILLIFVGRCIVLTPPSLGGGLARSTAAVFPLLCVAGVQGLDWSLAHLPRLRSLLAAAAAIIVTLHGGLEVVIGARAGGDAYRSHAASAASLVCGEESAAPARTVLSDRPATIGRLSGVPALPIPSDDLATVAEVAAQVGADVMVVGDGFIDEVPGLAVATLDRRRLVQIRMFDEGGEALFVYDITRLPNAVAIELAIEGDADRAARILRLALEHTSPESPGYMPMARNLGRILTEAGKPQEAVTALATALSTRPGDAAALYWLGRALISLGRYDEALDALRRVQDLDPEFAKSRGVADSVSDLRARIRRAARDGDERP